MDEIIEAFIEDGRDHLAAMESGLLRLEDGETDPGVMNAIFRAAHTIKGDAGVVGLSHIEKFAHQFEDYFDQMRKGLLTPEHALVSLMLRGVDHIKHQFAEVAAGQMEPKPELESAGNALREQLHALVGGAAPAAGEAAIAPTTTPAPATPLAACWQIIVDFAEDTFQQRMDPLDFLRHLATLGELVHIEVVTSRLPEAARLDAESCYLGFVVHLHSEASRADIEGVFDFVRDSCALSVLPPGDRVGDYIHRIEDLPDDPLRLGEILVRSAALTPDDLAKGLELLERETQSPQHGTLHLGEVLVEQHLLQPEIVAAATAKQQVSARKLDESRQIRVHTDKLDQLVDLVGEMVVSSASANLMARESGLSNLMEVNHGLGRLIERMRELSLQLRMVQIGDTFNRFKRVVRDIARDLDRDIALHISGAETELDKSVVEKIGDPLTHLIRNAIDHGIEPAATRLAAGKPAAGNIRLHAYHETGGIVIEVGDDGAGLDDEKILAKAIERGLVAEGQVLSPHEIHDLIFLPGFSTADQVTSLSGRGVGMDVVRANITAVRGTVEVQTERGVGTTFVIRLPLTMAIIDGFLVSVGAASYVIPLDMVMECTELQDSGADRDYLNLRGEVLPFVRLREFFAVAGARPGRENVVVVRAGKRRAGIIVDRLLGEFQTVIKPLSAVFRHVRGIAGSTILGDGTVALILDIPALTRMVAEIETARQKAAPRRGRE